MVKENSSLTASISKEDVSFPIVGIGASAGGLEALELFVAEIPPDSGLAFIIIQHQDPTYKGMFAEILQRHTLLPVYLIEDQIQVMPNCIYIIPPAVNLSINNHRLSLKKPTAPRGLRLPIDFFFKSLADSLGQQCIGVILSGMGSDGTVGVRYIKQKGGLVFVQEPSTAKFDSMPLSAMHLEIIDGVAPAEELPGKIISYLKNTATEKIKLNTDAQNALEQILLMIKATTSHDFSYYKKSTLYRRIERRIKLYRLPSINEYVQYLTEHEQEIKLLFKELLIGVTSFFRDFEVWEQLKNEVIPTILSNNLDGYILRAWVVACSTGEEAYSLAILFKEALEKLQPTNKNFSIQIFATDLDAEVINKARTGIFSRKCVANLTKSQLKHYFTERGDQYIVNKDIREKIIFATQNVLQDSPFTKLDIVSCRNLFIYLEPELQKKLLHLFHYSLKPDGILMLGSAETIDKATHLFKSLPGKTRLFKRLKSPRALEYVEFPMSYTHDMSEISIPISAQSKLKTLLPNLKIMVESILLHSYTPPALLVTESGDILYIQGKTGNYLEPAVGKANLNVFAMAREGLSEALHETFQRAVREQSPISVRGLKIQVNGDFQGVDVTIHPISEHRELTKMNLIIFKEVELPKEIKRLKVKSGKDMTRVNSLIEELQHSQRMLQRTREEMQASQEELRSANEELQSTNEELQSTNEELTTSKEEMQSMNEELQTVNNELQAKIDELSSTSNDMYNLLNSTNIAILFLDGNLKVRRFTNQVTNIIKLIPDDAGRQITDFASELNYSTFIEDIQSVLHTLIFKETQVSTHDNRWFIVRIMPYRTLENRIDGVVITFTDITLSKNLELELLKTQSNLKNLLEVQKDTHKVNLKKNITPGESL